MKTKTVVQLRVSKTLGNTLGRFGSSSFFKHKKDKDILEFTIVQNSEAQFVNLFGVCVDIKSGNIALGMFPNPDEYVLCGNLYDKLAKLWLGLSKMPDSIDMKYIVQLLKLDPVYYQDEIIQEVCYNLDSNNSNKSRSICASIIKSRYRIGESKPQKKFIEMSKSSDFIAKTARVCIDLYWKLEEVAKDYYYNFITEQYDADLRYHDGKTLEMSLRSGKPNLEAMTLRYVEKGFPVVFLNALKSYGFSIKDRRSLFTKTRKSQYTAQEIESIAVALSSMLYSRSNTKKELVLAYNFMDLMRSINWDQGIYFSLDLIVESGSKVVWNSLVNKFNIPDILRDRGLSQKEFVLGIDTYRKTISDRIDWGTCYNRVATMPQYRMVSYAPGQIERAGRVFSSVMSILNKSLQL